MVKLGLGSKIFTPSQGVVDAAPPADAFLSVADLVPARLCAWWIYGDLLSVSPVREIRPACCINDDLLSVFFRDGNSAGLVGQRISLLCFSRLRFCLPDGSTGISWLDFLYGNICRPDETGGISCLFYPRGKFCLPSGLTTVSCLIFT